MNVYFFLLIAVVNLVWIIPVWRQWSGRFRHYFLVVAAAAVFSLILLILHAARFSQNFLIIFSYLLPFILIRDEKFAKWKYLYLAFSGIIAFSLLYKPGLYTTDYIFIMLHVVVLIRLLKLVMVESSTDNNINLFTLLLIFYELTVILRGIYTINFVRPSILFNVITVTMDVAFGLFFCIFTEENKHLYIKIGSEDFGPNHS